MHLRIQATDAQSFYGVVGIAHSFGYEASKGTGALMVKVFIPDEEVGKWDDTDWEDNFDDFLKLITETFPQVDLRKGCVPSKGIILSTLEDTTP